MSTDTTWGTVSPRGVSEIPFLYHTLTSHTHPFPRVEGMGRWGRNPSVSIFTETH